MEKVLKPCLMLLWLISLGVGMTTVDPQPAGCEHNGRFFELHESYKPDPCNYCECIAVGQMDCIHGDCAPPQCAFPKDDPNECCPVCPYNPDPASKCHLNGRVYLDGYMISSNFCKQCYCNKGEMDCSWGYSCPPIMCVDGFLKTENIVNGADCCTICPNGYNCATPDGTIIPAGQKVTLPNGDECDCPEFPWQGLQCPPPGEK